MLSNFYPTCATVVLVVWLLLSLYRRLRSATSRIPGPAYTKLTSLWLMKQEFTSKRRPYIHQLHQEYGPIVRLAPNEVSFTSLDAIKEIYTSGGSGYDKTEFYTLFKQFDARTTFSTLGKVDHSQKKRYIASQYANTNIMHPEVMEGIQERSHAFVEKCSKSNGESMDAYAYLHCFALDCATHHLFHPYGTKSIEEEEGMTLMNELTYHESLKQNLADYYWPSITSLLGKFIRARPSPLSNDYVLSTSEKPSAGEHTLLYKLQNSKTFSQIQTAAECMDHMAAGIDTTGDALCFLMYQLSLPESWEVQEKMRQEFRENAGKSLDALAYLDAVVKEGLRCFPPIPMSQPRYVPEGGRTIDGYFIPAGTIVSAQAWSVHRLNKNVYLNGDRFLPERWLDEGKSLDMNRLFFAFGLGARGCIGRHLAMAEMKSLLKDVYSLFRTRIADDMKGSMDLSDQIISSRPLDQTCKLVFEEIRRQ